MNKNKYNNISEGLNFNNDLLKCYLSQLGISEKDVRESNRLDLLIELNIRHIAEFHFTSIDAILGNERTLDINDLFEQIVVNKTGGHCFEHNKLFAYILKSLNYNSRSVMARVLYNKSVDAPSCPKTHRLNIVDLDGSRYVVDVGFGVNGPRYPVKMSEEVTIEPHGNSYRIARNALNDYLLQILKNDEYYSVYGFDLNNYNEADFLMGYFYSLHYPDSGFLKNLVAARFLDAEIRSLRNDAFYKIKDSGAIVTQIKSDKHLQEILRLEFGHRIETEDCRILFEKYCRTKTES